MNEKDECLPDNPEPLKTIKGDGVKSQGIYITIPKRIHLLKPESRPDTLILEIHNQREVYPRHFRISRKKLLRYMKYWVEELDRKNE